MEPEELAFAGAARQAELIRAGEVSSRELVELYLGADRAPRPQDQRVHRGAWRARPGRGGRRRRPAVRRRIGPPARRPDRDQGQRRRRGRADAVRQRGIRPDAGDRRRRDRSPAARGRGGDHRQDDALGARDPAVHRDQGVGYHPQPVEPEPHARRLQRRQRRGGGRRAGRRRHGDRRRRLDPDPGGLLRARRAEAAAGAGADGAA